MSHFYGTMKGARGEATRCGTRASGMSVTAASWQGAVTVELWHDEVSGRDYYRVFLRSWHGRGESKFIEEGTL